VKVARIEHDQGVPAGRLRWDRFQVICLI
jgi:hypothetical protein